MELLSIKEKQRIMLDIMLEVDRICRENNIRYALAYGTLLGAVRHGGFIPWDDDLDIFMLREDFERFIKIYKNNKYHFLYNTRKKDEMLAVGYAKISDPSTMIINKKTHTKYGVYIDVFPLDPVPEKEEERRHYALKLRRLHNRLYHRQQKDIISIIKSYRHSLNWWWNKIDKEIHRGTYDKSPYYMALLGPCDNLVIEKKIFDNLKEIDFEGHKLMAFENHHIFLVQMFGEDYMTPRKYAHEYKIYRK